jgi:hypothetical protein
MSKKNNNVFAPSKEEVEQFSMLYPMIIADLAELRNLSNKKQDGALNKLKIGMINKKLEKVKLVLSNEPTTEFLDILNIDSLPSNSDAVFIILQFKSAMDQYKDKYYTIDDEDDRFEIDADWSWKTR